jgi:hypothetical protein
LIQRCVAALARAQTLLSDDRWAGADLKALLRGEPAGFLCAGEGAGQRPVLIGPENRRSSRG